jgi:nitroimidazol reductase NimA-like FMN-containing flavoprotein (pyridoxamine 5'-phosphate oxidase superfamily)
MLSKEDQSSLLDLAWHWEAAYTFSVIEGQWQAVPAADLSAVLTAATAEELREKVRQDYANRQASLRPIRGERMST